MTKALARIGRGGAGNFWSKADLDEAEKAEARNDDIEAQNADDPLRLTRTITSKPLTDYTKIGRGGAGNVVYTPESEASTSDLTRVTTARTINETAVERKKGPQVYQGHGGRGGAGNWRGNLVEEKRVWEAEEEKIRREVEIRVQSEVMGALKPPERAYRTPRGGRESEKVESRVPSCQ